MNDRLNAPRSNDISFYVGNVSSAVKFRSVNYKHFGRIKMATIPVPKQTMFRLLKFALVTEINVSLYLLSCGDISSNPGPSPSTGLNNLDEFKLPVKGLRFAHWNVNYMTKTKMEEIKMRVLQDGLKILDILVITETCFSNKTNEDLFAIPGYELYRKDRTTRSG